MASRHKKMVNGHGPYVYRSYYVDGEQRWEHLGPADEVDFVEGEPDRNDEGVKEGISIDVDQFDDPALTALVEQFEGEDIESVIDRMLFDPEEYDNYHNILSLVKDVVEDNQGLQDEIPHGEHLVANIEDIQQFDTDNPELTTIAAERVQEALGDLFDISITDPNNEFQDPMISLDVDKDARLTANSALNAAILEKAATRTRAETKKGQENIFERWRDALGEEEVVEFKRSLDDPDALGFAVPGDIPASGKGTPVTEIHGIGPKTAANMHPSGEDISLQDIENMSEMQSQWIDSPLKDKDLNDEMVLDAAERVVDNSENPTTTMARLLGWNDGRRARFGDYTDSANVVEVGHLDDFEEMMDDPAPVETLSEDGDTLDMTNQRGEKSRFTKEFAEFARTISDASEGSEILTEENKPMVVEMEDGSAIAVAPRRSN